MQLTVIKRYKKNKVANSYETMLYLTKKPNMTWRTF